MIFTETKLAGAFVIDLERREDERGFFARAFCQHEFEEHGLKPVIAQANVAFNRHRGCVRGMHFQFPPAAETKLVRVTRGAIASRTGTRSSRTARRRAIRSASSTRRRPRAGFVTTTRGSG